MPGGRKEAVIYSWLRALRAHLKRVGSWAAQLLPKLSAGHYALDGVTSTLRRAGKRARGYGGPGAAGRSPVGSGGRRGAQPCAAGRPGFWGAPQPYVTLMVATLQ